VEREFEVAQVATTTISGRLADYVTGMTLGALPAQTVRKTKQAVLDTVGCMLAGSTDRIGQIISKHVERQAPTGPCTVFGGARTVGPEHAALANGTAAHVLELDDGHRPSDNHLASVVVPAALAMAQATGASGPDLLLAVALGYDVMGRVGEAVLLPRQRGHFHGTGSTGGFGAATVAGKLLGLTSGQLVNALGIAGDGAASLSEYRNSPRSTGIDCKPLHAGRSTQTGITAALLAAEGLEGPDMIFEGRDGFCASFSGEPRPELICADLGQRFGVDESGFKVHASVGGNFTAIDAALWLRKEYQLEPASIDKISIAVPRWAQERKGGRETRPQTAGASRPNVFYVVAAALHDGEVTHRQHTPAKLADAGIAALEDRTEFVVDPEIEAIFEATKNDAQFFVPCAVSIEYRGQTVRRLERTPLGYDPERGLTDEEVQTKFRSLVAGVIPESTADRLIAWAMELDGAAKAEDISRILG
jgi:2-methylcitrate dehydratase PrpD